MALMRNSLGLFLVCLALMAGSCRDPMEHAHCDDTLLKRVPSPNGKLVIVIYNRSCSGNPSSTYAEVEDPAVWTIWPRGRHSEVCFLVTISGRYHQLDALWQDGRHIEISSTDEIDGAYDHISSQPTCDDIAVAYDFKFKPPPTQLAPDKETVAAIREAIKQSQSCIDEKFGSGHSNYLRSLVDDKQHRRALELLCTNLEVEKCTISKETYALLERAATRMAISRSYLENLKPLVQ